MSRYLVRTTSGDKGPFSAEHLLRLVQWGKLPSTARVIDAGTGKPVLVSDLMGPPEPQGLEDLPETPMEDEPVAPRRAFGPVPRASGGRGVRATGLGRAGNLSAARRGVVSSSRAGGRTAPRRSPSARRPALSQTALIAIIGGVAVVGLGVAMYFLWPRDQGWPDGTWVIDPESLVDAVKKDSSKAAELGAEQEKFLVGLMAVALKDFQLRIDGTKATAQGTMLGRPIPEKDRDNTLRALGSGRYEMRADRTGELATLTMRNGRLELQEVTGKGRDVTLVLRRK